MADNDFLDSSTKSVKLSCNGCAESLWLGNSASNSGNVLYTISNQGIFDWIIESSLNNGDISVVFAHFNTTQTISMYSGDPGATPPGGYLGEMSSAMFNSNPNTVHTSSTGYFQFALSQYSGDLPAVHNDPSGFEFFWVVQQYCTLCQALKYANAADATESLLCNARNYATVGDARGFGHTRCELCVVGTYKDTSMDSCKQCPENHLSDAGAISIDGCIQCEL